MSKFHLPPPKDWQEFERLCCSLWSKIWDDPNTKRYGRSGQKQDGVDVYGRKNNSNGYSGIQCKAKDQNLTTPATKVTPAELAKEVNKAKNFNAENLVEFILVHTGPKDAKIEKKVMELNNSGAYSFHIDLLAWEDIESKLYSHPEVMFYHYRELIEPIIAVAKKSKGKEYLKLYIQNMKRELDGFYNVLGSEFELHYSALEIANRNIPNFYLEQLDVELVYSINKIKEGITEFDPPPEPINQSKEDRKHKLLRILRELDELYKKL